MPLLPVFAFFVSAVSLLVMGASATGTSFVLLSSRSVRCSVRRLAADWEGAAQDYSQQKLIAENSASCNRRRQADRHSEPTRRASGTVYLFYGNLRGPVETWSVAKMREMRPARLRSESGITFGISLPVRENYHDVTIDWLRGNSSVGEATRFNWFV